jgi:hypothetical protein
MMDWVLSRLAGDADLEQAAAKAFERQDLALSLKIDARLAPGQPLEKARLELFESKGRMR